MTILSTVSESLQLAVQHHRANRLTQAEQAYRQVLKEQPQHPEALYGLGMLAQQVGQLQEAEKLLSTAVSVQPEFLNAWFSLGNLCQAQDKLPEAESAYQRAIDLQPDAAPIYNNLGYTLQQQGKLDEAIACYQKALEIQPNCIEADVNLGNALNIKGKLSPEKQAHYAGLNYDLGVARQKAGDRKTAIIYYRLAIAMKPDLIDAHYKLGLALQEQGEIEDAIASYHRALELNPNYGDVYLSLGKIYQDRNNLKEAISAYRQGLELINPHYATAVEAYQGCETTQEVPTTPPIPQGEVILGGHRFPAIAPVAEDTGKRPFWSVVIPTYNRTDYLLECLVSVLAQWQGEEQMEIIVIDDASTTPVFELVNSIGQGVIRYYRNPQNLRQQGTWNAGVFLSRGQWVHLLHDDDYVLPGFYDRLKESLEAGPDSVGAAFTGYENINDKREIVFHQQLYGKHRGIAENFLQKIGVANPLNPPAVVIRRATYEHLGAYHPELTATLDWELYKRITAFYDWWYEPEILVHYRQHSQSMRTKLSVSGVRTASIRRSIEIAESYLPPEHCAELTQKARKVYFTHCLADTQNSLDAGNLNGALCMLRETLAIDNSPEAVAQLFTWLRQDKASLLRDEIVQQLISLPLENLRIDPSKKTIELSKKIDETKFSDTLQLALQHHQAKRLVQAEESYCQVLVEQPDHPDALYGLGVLAQQKNQLQEAEKFLNKAVQVQPDHLKAWFSLGNLRQAQGQLPAAEAAYRQALALQPKLVAIQNNLGYTLQQQGKWEEAIACYQKALDLKPEFTEADVNWGNALYAQGKLSKEKQVHYAQLNHKLGVAGKQAGDLKNAITYYRQAITLQPDFVEAHYHLGMALQAQGNLEEAIACYQKTLELNPSLWDAYNNLGKIYQEQNNLEKAISIYRQGLKRINPHYASAVEAYSESAMADEVPVTPSIPQGEVTVGSYSFPAIAPVSAQKDKRPFWSVAITAYNRSDYLLECLASVLVQWSGEEEMEILVVDNASTPPLFELVNALGGGVIRYYRHPQNLGLIGNHNAGVVLSRGHWIHILNDDDYVLPDFYSRLKQSLDRVPDSVGAAFTGFENINEKGEVVSKGDIVDWYGEHRGIIPNWLSQIGVTNPLRPPAIVVRRATFERLGGYCPELTDVNGWELCKRIATFYNCWYEPEILARYRLDTNLHTHKMTNQLFLSGNHAIFIRRAIEIPKNYLPADLCAEITSKARSYNFKYLLERRVIIPLKAGSLTGALRMLQEALKIDHSPQAVAKLFAWLTQEEAAPLREEIISRLLSIPVGHYKSSITTEAKHLQTTIKA